MLAMQASPLVAHSPPDTAGGTSYPLASSRHCSFCSCCIEHVRIFGSLLCNTCYLISVIDPLLQVCPTSTPPPTSGAVSHPSSEVASSLYRQSECRQRTYARESALSIAKRGVRCARCVCSSGRPAAERAEPQTHSSAMAMRACPSHAHAMRCTLHKLSAAQARSLLRPFRLRTRGANGKSKLCVAARAKLWSTPGLPSS